MGRSCIVVECGKHKVMMDCGVKLEKAGDEYPLITPDMVKGLNAVVLTHAHLDHTGFLPVLFKMGYDGPVFATKPTRDLAQLLLADAHKIAISEKKQIFSEQDLLNCLKHFEYMEYRQKKKIAPDTFVTLFNTGHVVGSSGVLLQHCEETLYYTGDLCMRNSNVLNGADTNIGKIDYLIIESTYSSKKDVNPSLKVSSKQLADVIKQTMHRGGKVLIPTFGVGRGMEIMMTIDNYIKSGYLHKVPAYVDGMITKANKIYRQNVLWLREEIPRRILLADDDPFRSQNFSEPKRKDKKDVLEQKSVVIVATSGMLTGGPSVRYFERVAEGHNNAVILVGYQAEGTLGREVYDKNPVVMMPNGREIKVNCRVEKISFSAHADHPQLIEFISKIGRLKHIFIVHGEHEKIDEFKKELSEKFCVHAPRLGETFEVGTETVHVHTHTAKYVPIYEKPKQAVKKKPVRFSGRRMVQFSGGQKQTGQQTHRATSDGREPLQIFLPFREVQKYHNRKARGYRRNPRLRNS